MKLPNARDLNEEQEAVYLYAPTDGRVLVSGPPGTGKTVLALLRAVEMARAKKRPVVGMFNRMLEAYTSSKAPDGARHWSDIRIATVRQIFRGLWARLRVPPVDNCELVLLNAPFEDKEDAKALGARWNPNMWAPGRDRKGTWTVAGEIYRRSPASFSRWSPISELPAGDESEFSVDWELILKHLLAHGHICDWEGLDFDALIVDEGQDLPPSFYELLFLLTDGRLGNGSKKPFVMILADENQRLNYKANSTISDIERELRIPSDRHYRLTTNFRNTRQIAEAAAHFYAGMQTGVATLPTNQGQKPVLRRCSDIQSARAKILRYAENNPRHEIGVLLVNDDNARRRYFEEIRSKADKRTRVQTYAFRDPEFNNPGKQLVFDQPAITVLNLASCKGLEFDAVFIVHLEHARIQEDQLDFFKMGMYVMCARARTSLTLIWLGASGDQPDVLQYMPAEPNVKVAG